MIITDYLAQKDLSWDYALQCGVKYATVRLPDDPTFEPADFSLVKAAIDAYTAYGFTPVVLEPLPNCLHNSIKTAAPDRDLCIEKFIKLLSFLQKLQIGTVCFNFMAHVGWTRTDSHMPERGGASVTAFNLADFDPNTPEITEQQLWENYTYFISAVMPYAEKYGIRMALHPDDPPLPVLGKTARILTNLDAIQKAISIYPSDYLGVTFCQACYYLMGAPLDKTINELRDKIFFIHFRNVCGEKTCFRETFHDNGTLDMAKLLRLYAENGIDVPIRVDHVPAMAGEDVQNAGYDKLGRLYAIGYLRGLLEAIEGTDKIR